MKKGQAPADATYATPRRSDDSPQSNESPGVSFYDLLPPSVQMAFSSVRQAHDDPGSLMETQTPLPVLRSLLGIPYEPANEKPGARQEIGTPRPESVEDVPGGDFAMAMLGMEGRTNVLSPRAHKILTGPLGQSIHDIGRSPALQDLQLIKEGYPIASPVLDPLGGGNAIKWAGPLGDLRTPEVEDALRAVRSQNNKPLAGLQEHPGAYLDAPGINEDKMVPIFQRDPHYNGPLTVGDIIGGGGGGGGTLNLTPGLDVNKNQEISANLRGLMAIDRRMGLGTLSQLGSTPRNLISRGALADTRTDEILDRANSALVGGAIDFNGYRKMLQGVVYTPLQMVQSQTRALGPAMNESDPYHLHLLAGGQRANKSGGFGVTPLAAIPEKYPGVISHARINPDAPYGTHQNLDMASLHAGAPLMLSDVFGVRMTGAPYPGTVTNDRAYYNTVSDLYGDRLAAQVYRPSSASGATNGYFQSNLPLQLLMDANPKFFKQAAESMGMKGLARASGSGYGTLAPYIGRYYMKKGFEPEDFKR